MAPVPAGQAAALFPALGARPPSRRTRERLPRTVSGHWEAHPQQGEAAVQVQETGPAAAPTLAIAVAGARAPLHPAEADREARPANRPAPGTHASGPSGYREGGGGTLTRYEREGKRWPTLQSARRPDSQTVTRGKHLHADAQALLGARPDLRRG